jgi:DNA-binding NarL/FixJ family response regulator
MSPIAPLQVYIVEDNPDFRDKFASVVDAAPDMQRAGVAENLAGGMALLAAGPADVLLVDLGLPDGNGLTLIREAVRRWPGRMDIMVVSVFADEGHVLAAIEAGATGYLLKDARPADITAQIRELHAGGSPVSPVIARQLLLRLAPAPDMAGEAILSEQERNVLRLASKGYNYDEVAKRMGVSRHTVTTYVKRSYQKLQVHTKTEALHEARRLGLLPD